MPKITSSSPLTRPDSRAIEELNGVLTPCTQSSSIIYRLGSAHGLKLWEGLWIEVFDELAKCSFSVSRTCELPRLRWTPPSAARAPRARVLGKSRTSEDCARLPWKLPELFFSVQGSGLALKRSGCSRITGDSRASLLVLLWELPMLLWAAPAAMRANSAALRAPELCWELSGLPWQLTELPWLLQEPVRAPRAAPELPWE